ncbi:MAG: LysE family translocator [Pseudomonadota bacterium]
MDIHVLATFIVASAALLAIPGPTVTIVVGHAIAGGRGVARATVPGVVAGDFVAMTASLLGAGAILASSASLFTALKIVGAVYLVWLGIKLWRAPAALDKAQARGPALKQRAVFWNCFTVTALNPKDILFFVAFVPQFIDPAGPVLLQFVILEATFLTMVAINIALWSFGAGHLRQAFQRPSRMRALNRVGGSLLIGAGVLTSRA